MRDTYVMPADGWVCFHCGERFTKIGAAEDHFGGRPSDLTGCQIKAGDEKGLLMSLRREQNKLRWLERNSVMKNPKDITIYQQLIRSHI